MAALLPDLDADLVLNVQCDMPQLDPGHVDQVVRLLTDGAEVATLATHLRSNPGDPSKVKVVLDGSGHALYFSRVAIPTGGPWLRHIGLYGFTREALLRCTSAPVSPLETSEDLEQLRWLHAGERVRVGLVPHAAPSLDTLAQLRTWSPDPNSTDC